MSRVKILVVYQYYQDRDSPGHSLIFELTQHLAECGHEVTVVSGETGYMDSSAPGVAWYRRLVRREKVGKVAVIRTFTYSELHRSYTGRILSFLSFTLSSPFGLYAAGRPDVILASSPPLFPVYVAWIISAIRRIPFVLEVRDLWPASAVQMGVLRNPLLLKVMNWMERTLYNRSARIIALTEGIKADILGRGWSESKVELVTCGVDFDRLYPDDQAGEKTRALHGWQGKKVILYFGALGDANNIPVILRAAKNLRNHDDIVFVLVGNGMKRAEIEATLRHDRLLNVQVLPPVPKTEARQYICAADVCLVTLLDIPLFDGAIPTKLIDYMACGKPVLCGVRGEAQTIVESAGAGLTFEPDADTELCRHLLDIVADDTRCNEMGQRGLAFVQARFSARRMREQTEAILREAADPDTVADRRANGK